MKGKTSYPFLGEHSVDTDINYVYFFNRNGILIFSPVPERYGDVFSVKTS